MGQNHGTIVNIAMFYSTEYFGPLYSFRVLATRQACLRIAGTICSFLKYLIERMENRNQSMKVWLKQSNKS